LLDSLLKRTEGCLTFSSMAVSFIRAAAKL